MKAGGIVTERGEAGKALVLGPGRVGGVTVTDWTLAELMAEAIERGLDPADVTIEYLGCGTHEVEINWTDHERARIEEARREEAWQRALRPVPGETVPLEAGGANPDILDLPEET